METKIVDSDYSNSTKIIDNDNNGDNSTNSESTNKADIIKDSNIGEAKIIDANHDNVTSGTKIIDSSDSAIGGTKIIDNNWGDSSTSGTKIIDNSNSGNISGKKIIDSGNNNVTSGTRIIDSNGDNSNDDSNIGGGTKIIDANRDNNTGGTKIIDNDDSITGGTRIIDSTDDDSGSSGTKIISNDDNDVTGGTKIINNNDSGDTGGTKIIDSGDNNTAGETKIIDSSSNNSGAGGTIIIDKSDNTSGEKDSSTYNGENDIKRLTGSPIGRDITIGEWCVKRQMDTHSGEADLYIAQKDDATFVLKYYRNTHRPKIEVVRKIKALQNRHILKLLDYGFYNDRFFEVYEYIKFGNISATKKDGLYKYLPLSEEDIFLVTRDIVEAFNEFHNVGIIHRDIKSDNFMLRNVSPLDIVIGDFGIASVMDEGEELHKTKTAHHTVGYVPREFFTADYEGIGKGLDYYALGITLWELATGKNPFINPATGKMRNENHIIRDTFEGRVADDLLSQEPLLSKKLQDLIRGLLVMDYKKRWGYQEVIRHLSGEKVEIAQSVTQKIKVSINGKLYENEKDIARALKVDKKNVSLNTLKRVSEALLEVHSYIAQKVQAILQDITDRSELDIALLKITYLLDPDEPFQIFDPANNDKDATKYLVSTKSDIAECLKNAPEVIAYALTNTNSEQFECLSLILGDDLTKEILDMCDKEERHNKVYYNNGDNLYTLKILTKAYIIITGGAIRPFSAQNYKNVTLYDLQDIEPLNAEERTLLFFAVRRNSYMGDFIPWLELNTNEWQEDFCTMEQDDFFDYIKSIADRDALNAATKSAEEA